MDASGREAQNDSIKHSKNIKKNCWHVAYSSDWYHLSWDRLLLYWQSWDSMFVLYLRPRHAQWFRCVAAFMTISSFWSSVPLVLGKKVLFELKMQTHTYKVHMCIIHMYMTCMYFVSNAEFGMIWHVCRVTCCDAGILLSQAAQGGVLLISYALIWDSTWSTSWIWFHFQASIAVSG